MVRENARGNSGFGLTGTVVRVAFGMALALTLAIMALFASGMDYPCKRELPVNNLTLLVVGVALAAAVALLSVSERGRVLFDRLDRSVQHVDRVLMGLTLGMVVLQAVLVHSYCFVAGWDPGTTVWSAWSDVHGQGINVRYFSMYPNNLSLLIIVEWCMRVTLALGSEDMGLAVYLFCLLNVISYGIALWLAYWLGSRVASVGCGVLAWVVGVLLVWTSPWAGIAYSDAIMVAIPIIEVSLFVMAHRSHGRKVVVLWLLLGLVAGVGFSIKPQVIFPLLAGCFLELVAFVRRLFQRDAADKKSVVGERVAGMLVPVLGFALALSVTGMATRDLRERTDQNRAFGITHFLMMGLNPGTRGVFLQEDVDYSASFATVQERKEGNLERARKRVEEMGVQGLAQLFLDKLMINYNDGAFAWAMEGHFWGDPFFDDGLLTRLTRAVYVEDHRFYNLWCSFEQLVWIVVLGLTASGLLAGCGSEALTRGEGRHARARLGSELSVLTAHVALTLAMLSAFQLIFEARARYFFAFAMLYVLLAALGARGLRQRMLHCAGNTLPGEPDAAEDR